MDMINDTNLEFTDISSEAWREYRFEGGELVRIEEPRAIHVSEDGGHRVFDASGTSHYIPPRWIHLIWKAREGQPNFVL